MLQPIDINMGRIPIKSEMYSVLASTLLVISIPFGSLYSPAIIVLLVDTIVSQATLASGNLFNIKSTTASDILSQILSGCPSVTD